MDNDKEPILNDTQLANLYPIVKDYPETPLNNAVLATSLGIDEQKSFHLFKALINSGVIVRKYVNINVYKLTKKGLQLVFEAYKRTIRSKGSNNSMG